MYRYVAESTPPLIPPSLSLFFSLSLSHALPLCSFSLPLLHVGLSVGRFHQHSAEVLDMEMSPVDYIQSKYQDKYPTNRLEGTTRPLSKSPLLSSSISLLLRCEFILVLIY